MKLLKGILLSTLLLLGSCSSLLVGTSVAAVTYTGATVGLPPVALAAAAGATAFGTDAYIGSLEEFKHEAPPEGTAARIFYEIRKLGETTIYAIAAVVLLFPLLFKKGRVKVGNALEKVAAPLKKGASEDKSTLNNDDKAKRKGGLHGN